MGLLQTIKAKLFRRRQPDPAAAARCLPSKRRGDPAAFFLCAGRRGRAGIFPIKENTGAQANLVTASTAGRINSSLNINLEETTAMKSPIRRMARERRRGAGRIAPRSRRRSTTPAPATRRSRSATSARIRVRRRPTARSARRSTAYFDKVNAEGGVNGRKINFITLDDGYNPAKTVEQARKLVEQDEVLFLFHTLGTPPNTAIHKYMNQKKVPQLFVATGATKWGDPKNFPWTMGWQPNYQSEAHDLRAASSRDQARTRRSASSTRTTTTARTT